MHHFTFFYFFLHSSPLFPSPPLSLSLFALDMEILCNLLINDGKLNIVGAVVKILLTSSLNIIIKAQHSIM